MKKFTPIDHFEALFTNKNFELKEFGTSDKVLIFEKNSSIVESEILFLQREAPWAKIIYVMPSKEQRLIDKITTADSLIIYNNQNEIINLLKGSSFHFALIIGADKSILSQSLNNQAEVSLFDLYNA